MIRRIQALNYRCLRYIDVKLDNFHILVGPNGSGKTTFLDAVSFLSDLISHNLEAISHRTDNFYDLTWMRQEKKFELAVELEIPEELRNRLKDKLYGRIRYEIAMGLDNETNELSILAEKVFLKKEEETQSRKQRSPFPSERKAPKTIIRKSRENNVKEIINKVQNGRDYFYSEISEKRSNNFTVSYKLGPKKSALGNLPDDDSMFPVTTWLRRFLTMGVQPIYLDSKELKNPSLLRRGVYFTPEGSYLPWLIDKLRKSSKDNFSDWIAHLRTAIPDLKNVITKERPEERSRYLMIKYTNGLVAPSWTVSDGTLMLLALTIPAYLQDFRGVFLIEEPENGIHPGAIETIFQSLSSVYDAQVFMATHSPILLSAAKPEQILCFAKTESGAVDIVRGDRHPALRNWKGEVNISEYFASGVLG